MSTATEPGGTSVGHEDQLALETERDFLLASLDDLEAALAEDDLDPATYERLREDYTARAAAVVRSLASGRDLRPVPPSPPRWRRAAVAAAVTAFVVGSAALLTGSLGERLAGQTVTGNAQSGLPGRIRELEQRVEDDRRDAGARRDLARARLQARDLVGALKDFDAAARLDPADAESRAYGGWLVYQAGLVDDAVRRLDRAIAASPDYADAHLFRGIVLFRAKSDAAGAVTELERYLALMPAGPLDARVRALLDDARARATTSPTPPPTSTSPRRGAR